MPDQATEAPITDEELAAAIRVRGRQVRNGIKVLQLILDHIPRRHAASRGTVSRTSTATSPNPCGTSS
jgi:hypothetical protein